MNPVLFDVSLLLDEIIDEMDDMYGEDGENEPWWDKADRAHYNCLAEVAESLKEIVDKHVKV